jgi:hypothetical protein
VFFWVRVFLGSGAWVWVRVFFRVRVFLGSGVCFFHRRPSEKRQSIIPVIEMKARNFNNTNYGWSIFPRDSGEALFYFFDFALFLARFAFFFDCWRQIRQGSKQPTAACLA